MHQKNGMRGNAGTGRWALSALSCAIALLASGCVAPVVGMLAAHSESVSGLTSALSKDSQPTKITNSDYLALFNKHTVDGRDLYEVIKQMRIDLAQQRSSNAMLALTATATSAGAAIGAGPSAVNYSGLSDILVKQGLNLLVAEMRTRATTAAFEALDRHLDLILGSDAKAELAAESIELPSPGGLTDADAKRSLNLAAMAVAARLSAKMLDKAEADFKSLEPDYRALLEQRERAAQLLLTALDQRRAASRNPNGKAAEAQIKAALSADEIRYLDSQLKDAPLATFVGNMAAQNLAIKYLSAKDPSAYQQYQAQKTSVVSRTSAYLRTLSGVAAFGSLSTNVSESIISMAQNDKGALITNAKLIHAFGEASVPLVKKTVDVALNGAVFPSGFLHPPALFKLTEGEQAMELADAASVFKTLQIKGAKSGFAEALFRSDRPGWLASVMACDKAEAGRMLDSGVDRVSRNQFASGYFESAPAEARTGYTFVNAFTVPTLGKREQELPAMLLGADHRTSTRVLGGDELAKVQRSTSEHFDLWTNAQLMRLIFANRNGAPAVFATLSVGSVSLQPLPSPEALYAYELSIDKCNGARPAANKSPVSTKPSAKPEPPPPKSAPKLPPSGASTP